MIFYLSFIFRYLVILDKNTLKANTTIPHAVSMTSQMVGSYLVILIIYG